MLLNRAIFSLFLCASFSCFAHDLSLIPTQTNGFERNFNPFDPAIGIFYATDFIYEPLWIFNVWHPENDYPRLAHKVESSPDFLSFTYYLREGIKWSDGETFNADDVVFTVDYARRHPEYPINIDLYRQETNSGLVETVHKIDDYTVTFILHQPNTLAHQSIGALYPLPEHVFSSVEDPQNFQNQNPVGTGPFTQIEGFRTTSFKLCRNPHYYQAAQLHIDCLKFPLYSGNERLWAAARIGKIDWMGQGINQPHEQFTKHRETNQVWLAPGANTNVQINTSRAPLNDLNLRQALSMSLDREQMMNVDTFGLTSPTPWPVATGPGYASWYDESALEPYRYLMEYNPQKAISLLQNNGYIDTDGDGWRETPDGEIIDIGIAVPSGWIDWFNVVITMVKNFRAVGINAHVEGMDEQKWFERITTGEFDMYMMYTNPGITPWKIYSEMFDPTAMVKGQVSGQAMHQLRSKEIENWLSEFTRTGNAFQQRQIMTNIQVTVAENLPVFSLFANPIWYEYSTKNFTGWVTKENPYVRPQVHRGIPERLIHLLNLRPVDS